MTMKYITSGDTVIFDLLFNDELDCGLLNDYHQIIFSDYVQDGNLFEKYESNNFQGLIFIGSKFNQSVNNLPSIVTHLTFGLPRKLTQVNFLEPHKIFYKILLEVLVLINQ